MHVTSEDRIIVSSHRLSPLGSTCWRREALRGGNEGSTIDLVFIGIASHLFPERFASTSSATPPSAG
jgi:hypothetical protein